MPSGDKDAVWGRSTVQTACPLDCPDSCSLAVSVERGEVVTIDGSTREPVTDGYICGKVRRFGDRVYGRDRLKHPSVRAGAKGGGQFKQVSWNRALDTIAAHMTRIRGEYGAEAVLPFSYGGSNGLITQDTADAQLFRQFGASRLARTVCAAPSTAVHTAMYGRMPGVAYPDYRAARLIIIWGANPATSSIHLVPHVRAAQRAGAILVVIDPRRTKLAKLADVHLQVQPGTDIVVALAIHRFLFENGKADSAFLAKHTRGFERLRGRAEAWTIERAAAVAAIDPERLSRVAELYAERSPAVIRCGWGIERNANGGSAVAAVLALPAVGGKFGVQGGGFTMSNSGAWTIDRDAIVPDQDPSTRLVNMNQLGRALTEFQDPPVKLLFVYNCNPAATMPDQNRVLRGLQRSDLVTVVFDQVLTDTARWADIVLPATTFLEHYDLALGYGSISLQLVKPAIEPFGEARSNVEVFGDLAQRLDLTISPTLASDPEAVMHAAAGLQAGVADSLLQAGIAATECPDRPVLFSDVFPRTPDRKIELFPDALDQEAPAGLYGYREPSLAARTYPLVLLSPATEKTVSSTLGELSDRLSALQMHRSDARARGLGNGDSVRVFNALGEVLCPVAISADVKPGTVSLPKGLWSKHTMNGSTANALVADTSTDLGGGAVFNDARVEVTRVVTAAAAKGDVALWTAASPEKEVHCSRKNHGSV